MPWVREGSAQPWTRLQVTPIAEESASERQERRRRDERRARRRAAGRVTGFDAFVEAVPWIILFGVVVYGPIIWFAVYLWGPACFWGPTCLLGAS